MGRDRLPDALPELSAAGFGCAVSSSDKALAVAAVWSRQSGEKQRACMPQLIAAWASLLALLAKAAAELSVLEAPLPTKALMQVVTARLVAPASARSHWL